MTGKKQGKSLKEVLFKSWGSRISLISWVSALQENIKKLKPIRTYHT